MDSRGSSRSTHVSALTTLICASLGGVLFGAGVSAINGSRISVLAPVALILGVGWSWAGVAVLVGRFPTTLWRSAVAGVLVLVGAVSGYYLMDMLRGVYGTVDPVDGVALDWSSFANNVLFWSVFSLLVGPALGSVGAGTRRSDLTGLLCKLVVPAVAVAEMAYRLRSDMGPMSRPVASVTWTVVLVVASVFALALVARHIRPKAERP